MIKCPICNQLHDPDKGTGTCATASLTINAGTTTPLTIHSIEDLEVKRLHATAVKKDLDDLKAQLEFKKLALKDAISELTSAFNTSNQSLISAVQSMEDLFTSIDSSLRTGVIKHCVMNGVKKANAHMSIRTGTMVQYDAKEALDWCKEKDLFLTIDEKAFEKAAPAMGLDFVDVVEKDPVAVISYKE